MADYNLYHQLQRSKRNKDDSMYFKRFQQGDEVTYTGEKLFEGDDGKPLNLRGSLGVVVARSLNEEAGVVVEFDGHAFIMDENRHLAKYVKKAKPEGEPQKGPEVQKRRGVSGEDGQRKGGKRRKGQEDA